ncbi:MAG: ribosomal-protein-alanine N-acetyltransferase [Acidobacteria bacterium]|nr:MAG: ribosomal-protein-alanine N-acetyltransferase [Acidobacteriota bacterium]
MVSRFVERGALRGDEKALEQAENECFPDPWPGRFFSAEIEAPRRYCRVLVDAGGQLAAYLFCAWQYLDLHVLKVATRPGFRRQGLACLLMENAEAYVGHEGGETVTLEVRRSNVGAQELYSTMGYRCVGTRAGYYADGEDGLVMTKRF